MKNWVGVLVKILKRAKILKLDQAIFFPLCSENLWEIIQLRSECLWIREARKGPSSCFLCCGTFRNNSQVSWGEPKILNTRGDLLSLYPHVCLSNPRHPINSHHMAFPISNRKWNLGPVYRVTLVRLTNDPCQAPVANADWMLHTFCFCFWQK